MALKSILVACTLFPLSSLGQFGFETLSKPFTGAQQLAWESIASRNAEGQLQRSRAAASASLSAHRFSNTTANATRSTTIPSGPLITSSPSIARTTTFAESANCNASIQNSYHRMVTDIEEYTLTRGAVKTAMILDHESYVTFTMTGPTTYTTIYTRALKPGRVWQAYYPSNYQCCMDCYVYFPHVEVYYWPVPESEEVCANDSQPLVTAQAVLPTGAAKTAAVRFNSLYSNSSQPGEVSTVNADGFTFISPSVYVAFGDVSAGDACGAVGQKHTSITLGFAPGELQTVTALGKDHYDTTLGTRAFDPKNVLCSPDFSIPKLFLEQDSLAGISTYRPRIEIPSALHNLDPAWKSCSVDDYEGVDPPRQLVPASGFGDDPVATTSVSPVQQATPAATIAPLPKNTGGADPGESGGLTAGPPNDPPASDPPASDPPASDPPASDPPASNPAPDSPASDPAASGSPSIQDSAPANSDLPGIKSPSNIDPPNDSGNSDPTSTNAADPKEQPKAEIPNEFTPDTPKNNNNNGQVQPGQAQEGQNQGAQDGTSGPTQTAKDNDQPANVPLKADSPKPAQPAVVVQGQTIVQGAPAVTIGGKPVTYSKGSLYVDGVAAPAPTAVNTPQQLPPGPQPKAEAVPVSLGGFKFTPIVQPGADDTIERPAMAQPAVVVQGHTVRQDAPPVTINGNKVVYTGGSVQVGNTAVVVLPANRGQAPEPVFIQGMTVTPVAVPPAAANEGSSNKPENQARPVILVKGQTVTENGPAATVNGKPVVYSGGAVFAGGTRVTVPTLMPGQPPSPINVAGLSFTPQPVQTHGAGPVPAVLVAGHTLTEGAPAVSVNGAKLAYTSGSVYVNGKAAALPTPAPQPPKQEYQPVVVGGLSFYAATPASQPYRAPSPVATVAGQTVVWQTNGAVAIGGTTLQPGSPPITISGTPIFINPTALVVGSKTLPLAPSLPAQAIATLAGQTIFQNAGGAVVIADKTLVPGGPALTISGTPYTLASTALIAGSQSIPLSSPSNPPMLYDSTGQSFTVASNGGGLVIRPGATISAGGPAVTISGTPFSVVTSAGSTLLVEGTRTVPLAPATVTPPPLEIFASTITANADGAYVVGGKTVTPDGPAVTVSGTRVSLGHISGGVEVLVVGSSTSVIEGVVTRGGVGGNSSSTVLRGTGASPTAAGEPTSSSGIAGDIMAGLSSGASGMTPFLPSVGWGLLGVLLVVMAGWP
ncbi:MAG: hypothetical protein Q9207_003408 [Kuettlingeria erythrocarpa]